MTTNSDPCKSNSVPNPTPNALSKPVPPVPALIGDSKKSTTEWPTWREHPPLPPDTLGRLCLDLALFFFVLPVLLAGFAICAVVDLVRPKSR